MGDPRKQETTLGPVVSKASAEHIRKQISEAVSKGAKSLVPSDKHASIAKEGTTYVAPQVLIDVDHSMSIMKDETLYVISLSENVWLTRMRSGPVVGVMKVKSDEEALSLMNDSPYGLTASIWTNDEEAFQRLLPDVEAGTVFMNRCDYLHPALGRSVLPRLTAFG